MKNFLPKIIIVICAAVFVFGSVQLFKLRFESGDVYAPYSSLRSDPLGTMALYESIEKVPGISAQRDFSADNRLPDSPDTTYLHLASYRYEWEQIPADTFHEIDMFVRGGGRLVITLFPESSDFYEGLIRSNLNTSISTGTNANTSTNSTPSGKQNTKTNKPTNKKLPLDGGEPDIQLVSIADRWGVGFGLIGLPKDEHDVFEHARVLNRTDLPLPHTLEWHSGIVITNLDKAWQKIYTRGTSAVVAERKFGHGSVVIATDSYFLSNEAMLKDRHADFIAWLVGPSKTVVFDEAHLGVMDTSGLAGLMRKYRLFWVVGALILLAGLFIWKNSLSLVPPHAAEERNEYITGKESAGGFVNLLRRNISPAKLLPTCFAEWKKTAARSGKYSATRIQQAEIAFQIEDSLEPGSRNPIRAYQAVSAALEARTSKTQNRNPNA